MLLHYELLIDKNIICDLYSFHTWINNFVMFYYALLNNGTLLYDMLLQYGKSINLNVNCDLFFPRLTPQFYNVLLNYGRLLYNMLWNYVYRLSKDLEIDSDLRPFH